MAGSPNAVRFWRGVMPAGLFLLVFFVVPLGANGLQSVFTPDGIFTLRSYVALLSDPYYLGSIAQTVWLSALVTFICLVLGYPIAYLLVRRARRSAALLIFLLISPLLTSIVMRTYGWRVLLARRGLFNTLLMDLGLINAPVEMLNVPAAAVIGLVHVLVPFMVLSIATVLQGVDVRLEEAAEIHGATRWQVFWRVTFPLSLEGVGTGSILVFMIATGSFVTLLFLGGGSLQTLPLLIYQQFSITRNFEMAAAMSTVLLLIALVCMYLQLQFLRRRGA